MRRSLSILLSMILMLSSAMLLLSGEAMAASFSTDLYDNASNGVVDIGGTVTFTFKISSDVKFEFQAELSPSSGLTIQSISGDVDSNGATIVNNISSTSYSVTVICNASGAGDQTFTVSGLASTVSGSIESANFSDSDTVYIRSQAEIDESKQAEADAASKAAYESSVAASKAARESSEAASREAESRSIEESRQASAAAVSRSIEEAEEIRRRSIAEEENAKNSAEASRASEEDASRQAEEDSSIAEVIKESGIGNQSDSSSAGSSAESASESENASSEASLTAPKVSAYIKSTVGKKTFFFASEDSEIPAPEGLKAAELSIKGKKVAAFRGEDYPAGVFLVYGTFDEDTEPAFYYFDRKNFLFFAADLVPVPTETETEEASTKVTSGEITEEPVTSEPAVSGSGEYVEMRDLILLSGLSVVLGAGVALLIVALCRRKTKE